MGSCISRQKLGEFESHEMCLCVFVFLKSYRTKVVRCLL